MLPYLTAPSLPLPGAVTWTFERLSAVVVVRPGPQGSPELVAYLVAEKDDLDLDKLRSFAQDRLPSFLVPTVLMMIPSIPLSPTGKIHAAALPEPVWGSAKYPGRAGAGTLTEEALIQIWARVLDRPDIRAGDDFFQVGGHSLLAIRLVREIQAQLNVKISIRTLFRALVLADLAFVIDQASAER